MMRDHIQVKHQQEHDDCEGAFKSGSFGSLGLPLLPGNIALSTAVSIRSITLSKSVSTALATFWPVAALVSKYRKLKGIDWPQLRNKTKKKLGGFKMGNFILIKNRVQSYPCFSATSLAFHSVTTLLSSKSDLFPHNTMSGVSQYAWSWNKLLLLNATSVKHQDIK